MPSERKLVLYIAMSLDGYIATPDDDLTFLNIVAQPGEDYGYAEFTSTVDTVIMGRKTYDKVSSMGYEFPHGEKETYIITRTERPPNGSLQFYNGDIGELVRMLKQRDGANIYCDGGAEIVKALLQEDLIDEFYISVIPVLLGSGIVLFAQGRPEQRLHLVESTSFPSGLVQLHYVRGASER